MDVRASTRPRTARQGASAHTTPATPTSITTRVTLGPHGVGYARAQRPAPFTDSSAAELLDRLNRAYRRPAVLSALLGVSLAAALLTGMSLGSGWGATVIFGATGMVVLRFAHKGERSDHSVSVVYDFQAGAGHGYRKLVKAFAALARSGFVWHLRRAPARAGTSSKPRVVRRRLRLRSALPPGVKSNLRVPMLRAGRQRLYFFPDRMLVYEAQMVWAVDYADLRVEAAERRVRDTHAATATVPHGFLGLRCAAGLNEVFQCASPRAAGDMAEALTAMRQNGSALVARQPA
jgi:hypothetical protein